MIRSKPHFLLAVIVLAVSQSAFLASSAAAISDAGAPSPLQVLCDGDCSGLPATPSLHNGSTFDFELGLRAELGGFGLSLRSDGHIFLVGSLRATESIRLFGKTGIEFHGNVEISSDEVHLDSGLVVPELPTIIRPEPGGPFYDPICACLSIGGPVISGGAGGSGGSGLEITNRGDIRRVASPVMAHEPRSFEDFTGAVGSKTVQTRLIGGLTVSRSGDLFVDLSRVTLDRLSVKAGGSIVIAGIESLPIPEPGSALLLGLGLATLAGSRRRSPAN